MNTPQSRLVREAVLRELDAGRHVHIRPQRLPPECLDRVEALADKHGIDRDFASRLAAELHRYEDAA
jgi:ribosome assembly protein YihI (activator of Der GTPase)